MGCACSTTSDVRNQNRVNKDLETSNIVQEIINSRVGTQQQQQQQQQQQPPLSGRLSGRAGRRTIGSGGVAAVSAGGKYIHKVIHSRGDTDDKSSSVLTQGRTGSFEETAPSSSPQLPQQDTLSNSKFSSGVGHVLPGEAIPLTRRRSSQQVTSPVAPPEGVFARRGSLRMDLLAPLDRAPSPHLVAGGATSDLSRPPRNPPLDRSVTEDVLVSSYQRIQQQRDLLQLQQAEKLRQARQLPGQGSQQSLGVSMEGVRTTRLERAASTPWAVSVPRLGAGAPAANAAFVPPRLIRGPTMNSVLAQQESSQGSELDSLNTADLAELQEVNEENLERASPLEASLGEVTPAHSNSSGSIFGRDDDDDDDAQIKEPLRPSKYDGDGVGTLMRRPSFGSGIRFMPLTEANVHLMCAPLPSGVMVFEWVRCKGDLCRSQFFRPGAAAEN